MLVYKEPEERCIHKIVGYGAIMFLLLYILRFIKYLSKRNKESVNERGPRKSRANIKQRGSAEKRSKSRHKNRRRQKTIPDQCPSRDYCTCSCSFHDQE